MHTTPSHHHDATRQASGAGAVPTLLETLSPVSVADQRLRAQVLERLSQTALRWLGIRIEVQDGLVRLCGSLRDARLRAHAEWLVFTTEGVQAVCSDWHTAPGQRQPAQSH
ncbi:hypothetical protein [Thiomonas sp.]